ncbi:MAG: SapC family protein [Alphaproteobacteria bacterium]|nr:SapC family protein [Alphaproteobacteria bacterium]MBV8549470.1 SapC family protein [Alphaproteobacteria bacterium]
MASQQSTAATQDNSLPMFYTAPRPLDRVRDLDTKLSRPNGFGFARNTNAIPLLIDEFPAACVHYPIVFAAGPAPIPTAVVGLKNNENLLVNSKGEWLNGTYLPAYVRRYPFILMDDPVQQQFVLCIDEGSGLFGKQGEFPLFENGEPSAFTKNAVEFCSTLRAQGENTDQFIKALQQHDLLMQNDAQVDLGNGNKIQLSGFLVINPQKFDALPDDVVLDWRRRGWLGLIYAHFISSHRWQGLVNLLHSPT